MAKKKQPKVEEDLWRNYNIAMVYSEAREMLYPKLMKYAEDKALIYCNKFNTPEYIHFYQIVHTYYRKNVFTNIKNDIKDACNDTMDDIIDKVMEKIKESLRDTTSIDHNIQISNKDAQDIANLYYKMYYPKAIKMFERSSYYKKLII